MATDLVLRREGQHLVPITSFDAEMLDRLPADKDLQAKVTQKRSWKHHRFFWGLLTKTCESHPHYTRAEQLLIWLKIRLGYVDEISIVGGKPYYRVSSIAWGSMDQAAFMQFFDSCIDLIVQEVLPGVKRRDLINETESMLGLSWDSLWQQRRS